MEILGRTQIALTMNTYSHVAPEVPRRRPTRRPRRSGRTMRTRPTIPKRQSWRAPDEGGCCSHCCPAASADTKAAWPTVHDLGTSWCACGPSG